MKKAIIKTLIWVGVLMMATTTVHAQNKADTVKQKHTESVVIYGSSKPVTGQALKIGRKPKVPALQMSTVPLAARLSNPTVPTNFAFKEVKPGRPVAFSAKEQVWNNLLTFGLGSRISPLLEYFYSGGKPKKYLLTVNLRHHSSFLNIKDYLPSPYTASLAGGSYDKFFRYHVLSVHGQYEIRTNRYYGWKHEGDTNTYDTDDPRLKQYYQTASFGIKFASNYRTQYKLNHLFRADGYYLWDRHGMSETNYRFDFDLHKGFRVTQIFNHQQLGIQGGFDYYKNETTAIPQNDVVNSDYYGRFLPYFDARYGIFSFKAGLNLEWLKQQQGKLHFYPYVHVNVNVAPGIFSFFAGVKGGLQKNSLRTLSRINPFLSSELIDFRWENTKFEAYGGFRGNILRHFGFEMRAGYRSFSDMALFDHVQYTFIGPYPNVYNAQGKLIPFKDDFAVYYANGHVFDLSGSLTYGNTPHLDMWLTGTYHSYSLKNSLKPLYKPLVEFKLGTAYVAGKITPWVEVYYMGHRWAHRLPYYNPYSSAVYPTANNLPFEYTLDDYFDLNLGVKYRIDRQLSAFIRVTNLLNKQYDLFDEYPVNGLEIMVGVRYRF